MSKGACTLHFDCSKWHLDDCQYSMSADIEGSLTRSLQSAEHRSATKHRGNEGSAISHCTLQATSGKYCRQQACWGS